MFYRQVVFFVSALFFLSACSSIVSVEIDNKENSNLNNRLDDVPLTIIVYQLKDITKFEKANDLDLSTREDGVLGKDKIDSFKMQIAPNDSVIAVKVNDEEVPYIGVFALFANPAKKITKLWAKTEDARGFGKNKSLKFEVNKEGIAKIR